MPSATHEVDLASDGVMETFYTRLFPFKPLFHWLNHGEVPTRTFTHREFAFTLKGDVYLRYNSFENVDAFKKTVCQLKPSRFEIGPVYSARPKDKKTLGAGRLAPLERELVFDIDMTDYDSVRTCCSEADICTRCWGFIACAVRVLHSAITEQFGFTRLLWVYSGRRGIHLWVSDQEAMELTDELRKAMVGWLNVIQGGKDVHKKVNVRHGNRALPPSLKNALGHLAVAFTDLILEDQDCFASDKGWEALLHLIPNHSAEQLRQKWSSAPSRSSIDKWSDVKGEVRKFDKNSPEGIAIRAAVEDVILQYTYPRIDAEVSKHRNHLLKSPFCVHPKTGRVCVPVDPDTVERFDPSRVPTVGQLIAELDAARAADDAEEDGTPKSREKEWEKTSLKPYVDMLERHAKGIMEDVRRTKLQETDMTW